MLIRLKKYCPGCKQTLSISEFFLNRSRHDGHADYCKKCARAYCLKWERKNAKYVCKRHCEYARTPNQYSKKRYRLLKDRAKTRGENFNLTQEEFRRWYSTQEQTCYYCEQQLSQTGRYEDNVSTIDRKDNKELYILENMALACKRCNRVKSDIFTETQMLEIARKYFSEGGR